MLAILRALLLLGLTRLGLGPAPADPLLLGPFDPTVPRLLRAVAGDEKFDPAEALHGSFSNPEQCRTIPGAFWIEWQGEGDCIRTYAAGLAPGENPVVLVYFGGDVLLRTVRGERRIADSYGRRSPAWATEEMRQWSAEAGLPAIFVARPGIYGSSGDHNRRRELREIELMDRTLDALKEEHGISSFILSGHSAGGQIVAALLNRRRDIQAAVISSGLVSVGQVSAFWEYRRKIPGRFLYRADRFHDPVKEVEQIARDPAPAIYVLSDPEDRSVPFFSQLYYVRRLRAQGLKPIHVYLRASDPSRHALAYHGRLAAALLARGMDEAQIRRALLAFELDELAHPRRDD